MHARSITRPAATTFCSLACLLAGTPGHPADFGLSSRVLSLPETGIVTNWLLHCEQGLFSFMPPPGWRLDSDAARSSMVLKSKEGAQIVVRLEVANPALRGPLKPEDLRQHLLATYEGSRVLAESKCSTEAESGLAFDLAWQPSGAPPQQLRCAFVRVGELPFSFTFSGTPAQHAALLTAFQDLMTSFQLQRRSSG